MFLQYTLIRVVTIKVKIINQVKKFLVLFLATFSILFAQDVYAQFKPAIVLNDPDYDFERRLRFGFSLGINFMDFQVKSSTDPQQSFLGETTMFFVDNSRLIPGFNVNAISDFRIIPTLHLRFLPGLAFGQRDLSFYYPDDNLSRTVKLESSFIELPLSLKYAAVRKTNIRPYLIAGSNFRIDMAAYKKLDPEENILLRLVKGDLYYEFGFGVDYFLTYFKFSTEVKFSSGFLNVFAKDYADGAEHYAQAISGLRSQLITIAFHFE